MTVFHDPTTGKAPSEKPAVSPVTGRKDSAPTTARMISTKHVPNADERRK